MTETGGGSGRALDRGQRRSRHLRQQAIVVVEEGDPAPAGGGEPRVPRPRESPVLLEPQATNARMRRELHRPRGGIVDDDHLDVAEGLVESALHSSLDLLVAVMRGDHDRQGWACFVHATRGLGHGRALTMRRYFRIERLLMSPWVCRRSRRKRSWWYGDRRFSLCPITLRIRMSREQRSHRVRRSEARSCLLFVSRSPSLKPGARCRSPCSSGRPCAGTSTAGKQAGVCGRGSSPRSARRRLEVRSARVAPVGRERVPHRVRRPRHGDVLDDHARPAERVLCAFRNGASRRPPCRTCAWRRRELDASGSPAADFGTPRRARRNRLHHRQQWQASPRDRGWLSQLPDARATAYSRSPAASRACLGSRYSRTRITLPLLNSTIQAIADSVIAPLSLPRPRR